MKEDWWRTFVSGQGARPFLGLDDLVFLREFDENSQLASATRERGGYNREKNPSFFSSF